LSIVKHLVSRMRGTIAVVSGPEGGTVFRVALRPATERLSSSPGSVKAEAAPAGASDADPLV
jgi:hypothetical protein